MLFISKTFPLHTNRADISSITLTPLMSANSLVDDAKDIKDKKNKVNFNYDTDSILLELIYLHKEELFQRGTTGKSWQGILNEFNSRLNLSVLQSRTLSNRFRILSKDVNLRFINKTMSQNVPLTENERMVMYLNQFFSRKKGKKIEKERSKGYLQKQEEENYLYYNQDRNSKSPFPSPSPSLDSSLISNPSIKESKPGLTQHSGKISPIPTPANQEYPQQQPQQLYQVAPPPPPQPSFPAHIPQGAPNSSRASISGSNHPLSYAHPTQYQQRQGSVQLEPPFLFQPRFSNFPVNPPPPGVVRSMTPTSTLTTPIKERAYNVSPVKAQGNDPINYSYYPSNEKTPATDMVAFHDPNIRNQATNTNNSSNAFPPQQTQARISNANSMPFPPKKHHAPPHNHPFSNHPTSLQGLGSVVTEPYNQQPSSLEPLEVKEQERNDEVLELKKEFYEFKYEILSKLNQIIHSLDTSK